MGFESYSCSIQFAIAGGTNVVLLRVLIHTSNFRNGQGWVQVNGGAKPSLAVIPITGMTSTGTVCTATTAYPHGIVNGRRSNSMVQLPVKLCIRFRKLLFPLRRFSWSRCVLSDRLFHRRFSPHDHYIYVPLHISFRHPSPPGVNQGLTVSSAAFCVDESRYFGCFQNNREAIWLAVPLGSTEVTSGATNTIVFGFAGDSTAVVHGWRVLYLNIVQPDFQMDQIVVSGSSAQARTTSANPFAMGDTLILRDPPGPQWRFNGVHTASSITDRTHFNFAWGTDLPGQTPGTAPYTTANGTYIVPAVNSTYTGYVYAPAMYVSRGLIPYGDYVYENPATYNYGAGNPTNGLSDFTTATST